MPQIFQFFSFRILTCFTIFGFNVPLKVNKSTTQTIYASVATASFKIVNISYKNKTLFLVLKVNSTQKILHSTS